MKTIYCPLSMIGGEPARCLRAYDNNGCYFCPGDSMSKAASSLYDLVSVIDEKDAYDSNTGIANALADIADSLNYPASLFGTAEIADSISSIAHALKDPDLPAQAEGRE